jgi:hypothetical protein
MSTLDVQTLLNVQTLKSNTANTPPVIQDANGTQVGTLCRAWVNFNGGGTVAIRGAFNVSSITDNGVGAYVVNIINSMPDTNYAVTITGRFLGGAGSTTAGGACALDTSISTTVTTIPIITVTKDTVSRIDNPEVCVAIFR